MNKLNSRQKLVLINALKGMNQDKSYGEVYGYTVATQQRASELFRNPVFKAELSRLQDKQLVAVQKSILSRTEKRQLLANFARAQLIDLIDDNGQVKVNKNSQAAKALKEWYRRVKVDKDGNPVVTSSIKLIDPIAAIMEDNKMSGDYAPSRHLFANRDISVEMVEEPNNQENLE